MLELHLSFKQEEEMKEVRSYLKRIGKAGSLSLDIQEVAKHLAKYILPTYSKMSYDRKVELGRISIKLYKFIVDTQWVATCKEEELADGYCIYSVSKIKEKVGLTSKGFDLAKQILEDAGVLVTLKFKDNRKYYRNFYLALSEPLNEKEKQELLKLMKCSHYQK